MEDLKLKLNKLENIVNFALDKNLLHFGNVKTYLKILDNDLEALQKIKAETDLIEYQLLSDRCIESIIILQSLIEIIKGIE